MTDWLTPNHMAAHGSIQNSISHHRYMTIRRARQTKKYIPFSPICSLCVPYIVTTSANCQSNMSTTSVLFVALHFSIKSLSFKCQITRNHNHSFQLNFLRKLYLLDWLDVYVYTFLIRVDSWTGTALEFTLFDFHHTTTISKWEQSTQSNPKSAGDSLGIILRVQLWLSYQNHNLIIFSYSFTPFCACFLLKIWLID